MQIIQKAKDFIFTNFYQYFPNSLQQYFSRRMVLVPTEELDKKYAEAVKYLSGRGTLGDYLEFGVFRGSSLLCMHRALENANIKNVRLFGFDSFEGLPDSRDKQDEALSWQPGMFNTSLEETKSILQNGGVDWKKTFLIKGWYTDTLTSELVDKYQITNVSLIMMDCDLYSSAKQALEFCGPLIKKEAIIFFDDWDAGANLADRNLGEKLAFDEFLKSNPQFKATEFGSYYHTERKNRPVSKIFLVSKQ
jgi:O-methyltransferase